VPDPHGRYCPSMNIGWNDPAWWSAIAAALAFLVAIASFCAARRSATASESATKLAKGLARTCHARWDIRRGNPNLKLEQLQGNYRTAYFSNSGEEAAFNVKLFVGGVAKNDPVAKVQPGEEFEFKYDAKIDPNQDLEVVIEWDRPEEFEEARMRTRRTF